MITFVILLWTVLAPPPVATADLGARIEAASHTIFITAVTLNAREMVRPGTQTLLVSTEAMTTIEHANERLLHLGPELRDALHDYTVAKATHQDLAEPRFAIQALVLRVVRAMATMSRVIPTGTVPAIEECITHIQAWLAQVRSYAGI